MVWLQTTLLAGAESYLLSISSHLSGVRPSFTPPQMEEKGWITGGNGPVELGWEILKLTCRWVSAVLETGLCRRLRSLGHHSFRAEPVKVWGPEAEMARDHRLRSHGSGKEGPTGRVSSGEGASAAGGAGGWLGWNNFPLLACNNTVRINRYSVRCRIQTQKCKPCRWLLISQHSQP